MGLLPRNVAVVIVWCVLATFAQGEQIVPPSKPASRKVVAGVGCLRPHRISLRLERGKQTVDYPRKPECQVIWHRLGRSPVGLLAGHVGDQQMRLIYEIVTSLGADYQHLLHGEQRLPMRARLAEGKVEQVEIFPPILYFCRVEAVIEPNDLVQIVLDPAPERPSMAGGALPKGFEKFSLWLPLRRKAVLHLNFQDVTCGGLKGRFPAVAWLNRAGEVVHMDAFAYDTTCWRTVLDLEHRMLVEVRDHQDATDAYDEVRRIPLAANVRIHDIWARLIPLEKFPVNLYETPVHTWVKLNAAGQAEWIITFFEPE